MPSIRQNGSPSIIMRSAKVPLSPSSALQTMYFWSAEALRTVVHLMPVGKPDAAAPTQAGLGDLLGDRLVAHGNGVAQPDEAAVRAIVGDVDGIDDAAALVGEPRLAGEEGDLLRTAEAQSMRAALQQASGEQAVDIAGPHRPVGDAALGRKRPRPSAPTKTGRASRCGRWPPRRRHLAASALATLSAPTARAPASQGT